jgi:rubrerythrin
MNLEDPVMVYLARNNNVLFELTNMLKDAGIESYASEDDSQAGLLLTGGWPTAIVEAHFKAQIYVSRKDADRAAELLREYENRLEERAPSHTEGTSLVQVVCPECHEVGTFPIAHLGTVQECPHCGKFMDVETEPDPDEDWGEPEPDEPVE